MCTVSFVARHHRQTIQLAKRIGAELVITHHPVIFRAQKVFTAPDCAYELAAANIAAICAHTSLDCADGGVNQVLADLLCVTKAERFPTEEFPEGMVRAGLFSAENGEELAIHVGDRLGCAVRYYDAGKPIETVAVCGGGGGSFIHEIIDAGIDAYITGCGASSVFGRGRSRRYAHCRGHYETENPVIPVLAEKLRRRFPDLEVALLEQDLPADVYYPEMLR
jgi:putative NIF3 family GTP cyclohydrolase 1 type 2